MAAVSQKSAFSFEKLTLQLKEIKEHSETLSDLPQKIRDLCEEIHNWLWNDLELKEFRHSFFAFEVGNAARQLSHYQKSSEPLIQLVEKVVRASTYLQKSLVNTYFRPLIERPNDTELPELTRALAENKVEVLKHFSEHLEPLGKQQIRSLFNWAIQNWNVEILCNLLEHTDLTPSDGDQLVDKALAKKELDLISFPLIFHHFSALSPKSQKKVLEWSQERAFGLQEVGIALSELKETLEETCVDAPCDEFREWPVIDSKEDLKPLIDQISNLFSQIPAQKITSLTIAAYKGWKRFLKATDVPLSEMQKCVRQIKNALVGQLFLSREPQTTQQATRTAAHEEEKCDTRPAYEQLKEAMSHSNDSLVKKTIESSDLCSSFSSDEMYSLLKEAAGLPSTACLEALLKHYHFSNLASDFFVPLLEKVLWEQKWEAAQFLMSTRSFQKLEADSISKISTHLPDSTPDGIRFLIYERL